MFIESEALVKGHSEVFNCVHYGQLFPKESDGRDRDLAVHLTGSKDAEPFYSSDHTVVYRTCTCI